MRRLLMWNVCTLDGLFEGAKPWDLSFHDTVWGDELQRFSLERLIRFASRIGGDVNVTVTWTERKRIIRLAPTRSILILRD